MSLMLSAPAAIPATSEESFDPALAPLSVGTLNRSSASSRSPALPANAISGTSPAADTRFGLIERCGHHRAGMGKLHLQDALLDLAIRTLSKSYLPSSEGHLGIPRPSTHRWIEAKSASGMPRAPTGIAFTGDSPGATALPDDGGGIQDPRRRPGGS